MLNCNFIIKLIRHLPKKTLKIVQILYNPYLIFIYFELCKRLHNHFIPKLTAPQFNPTMAKKIIL